MVQVRDSVAWTIGRVCEHSPKALLQPAYLPVLLQKLLELLVKEVRVAVNACWVSGCRHGNRTTDNNQCLVLF